MAVVFFAWLAVFKNDTGSHGIGSLDVGVVKAFDMPWLDRKTQVFFHLRHDSVGMPVRIYDLQLFQLVHTVEFCVSDREFQDLLFVS
ncbi:hypothetical protein D9M72_474330 [compost metagenome]